MQDERFTVDGVTYVVRRVSKVTTYSIPNEWTVFFLREDTMDLYGVSFPKGEDWRNAPFYNVRKNGELLHPRTLVEALTLTVTK